MEAVTAISKNLLKNTTVAIGVGVVLGLLIGLLFGWVIWPVQWTNGTPEVLRSDLQEDHLRMAIDSFARTGDLDAYPASGEPCECRSGSASAICQCDPGGKGAAPYDSTPGNILWAEFCADSGIVVGACFGCGWRDLCVAPAPQGLGYSHACYAG